jgi:RNA polymerase subunit RPABC4/transcription elongation factor Spt4
MEQFFSNISTSLQYFTGNMTLDLALKVVIIYFFVFWGALVVWVIKDITNRTTNIFLQVIAILLVLIFTPLFGLPVYLLIRPRSTIFEQYYENAEIETLETEESAHYCFSCNAVIEKDFHFCPYCRAELRVECPGCSHLIQKKWELCPYCGLEQAKETKPKKAATKKKMADLTLEVQEEVEKEIKVEVETKIEA